jgi:hypothetical protein
LSDFSGKRVDGNPRKKIECSKNIWHPCIESLGAVRER